MFKNILGSETGIWSKEKVQLYYINDQEEIEWYSIIANFEDLFLGSIDIDFISACCDFPTCTPYIRLHLTEECWGWYRREIPELIS